MHTMALCTMPLPTRLTVPHPSLDSVEVGLVPPRYCQRLQAFAGIINDWLTTKVPMELENMFLLLILE